MRRWSSGISMAGFAWRGITVYVFLIGWLVILSHILSWVIGNPTYSLNGIEAAKIVTVLLGGVTAMVLGVALVIAVANKILKRYQTNWDEM